MNRVCIVGVGLVSSCGWSLSTTWKALIAGGSGISTLPLEYGSGKRGYLVDFGPVKFSGYNNRLITLASRAARASFRGLPIRSVDTICVGSTSSAFNSMEDEVFGRVDYSALPSNLVSELGRTYKSSRNYQMSQACASSSYAIATAADLIRIGESRIALAGGADEVAASVVASFDSCRIYSDRCRPFDINRNGVVLGEAAAFVVMMSVDLAYEYNLIPLCYLDGIGLTCDAQSEAATNETGISRAIALALEDAGARVETIDFVSAHGTGTKQNDLTEARAIRSVFGRHRPPVASYKGALGHPQGASGAVGVALLVRAMGLDVCFPNAGMERQDPDIDLYIPVEHRSIPISSSMCLSYGSWGVNSALVLSKI